MTCSSPHVNLLTYTPTLKSRSNATRGHKTQTWLKNGPIWVRRPLVKCTGGETGPRKRFPLVPRPSEAKKGPKRLKFKHLPLIYFSCRMGQTWVRLQRILIFEPLRGGTPDQPLASARRLARRRRRGASAPRSAGALAVSSFMIARP